MTELGPHWPKPRAGLPASRILRAYARMIGRGLLLPARLRLALDMMADIEEERERARAVTQ